MLGFIGVAGLESLAGLFLKIVNAGEKNKEIYSMVLINEEVCEDPRPLTALPLILTTLMIDGCVRQMSITL